MRPGWYENPDGAPGGRFWDGEEWTDRTISELPEQGWYPNPEGGNDRYWDGHDWTSITKASGYSGKQQEVSVEDNSGAREVVGGGFSDRKKMALAMLAFFAVLGLFIANTGKAKLHAAGHLPRPVSKAITAGEGPKPSEASRPSTTGRPAGSTTTTAPLGPIGSYDGNGDDILKLNAPLSTMNLVYATSQGDSNFILVAQDAAGQSQGLLVNTIGAYQGTTAFTGESAAFIAVSATGPWHLEIKSLRSARSWDGRGPLIGAADDVIAIPGGTSAYRPVAFSFSGDGNFIVQSYAGDGIPNLLVNAIDRYAGTVGLPKGTVCVVVRAPSPWTGTPS